MSSFRAPVFRIRQIEAAKWIVERRFLGIFWSVQVEIGYGVSEDLRLASRPAAVEWVERETARLHDLHRQQQLLAKSARTPSVPAFRIVPLKDGRASVEVRKFIRWHPLRASDSPNSVPVVCATVADAEFYVDREIAAIRSRWTGNPVPMLGGTAYRYP